MKQSLELRLALLEAKIKTHSTAIRYIVLAMFTIAVAVTILAIIERNN